MNAPQQAVEFLAEPNICVLATSGPGDATHAMPMWYLYDEGDILFSSYRKSQKVRNVERSGKATVVIDRRDPPYYAVMVKGTATIEPAFSREKEFAMASRYLDDERARRHSAAIAGDSDSVSIRVRPERFVEYHGRANGDDAAE